MGSILDASFPFKVSGIYFHELFNLVYSINCSECPMSYIGHTSTKLNIRINNHRSSIKKPDNKQDNKVNTESIHFKTHSFQNSKIDILKFEAVESRRVNLESQFMFQRASLYPYGLNDRYHNCNIKDVLQSSCIFSLFSSQKNYEYKRKVRSLLKNRGKFKISFEDFFKKIDTPESKQYEVKIKYYIGVIKNRKNSFLLKFIQNIDKYKFQVTRIKHLITDLIKFKLGLSNNPPPRLPFNHNSSYLVLPFTRFFTPFDLRKCIFSSELLRIFPSHLKYPKLTYKLDLPFSKLAFNYREFCTSLPDLSYPNNLNSIPCFCNQPDFTPFVDKHHKHIVTGNLDIVGDELLKQCFSFGTKFRPIFPISKTFYFNKINFFLKNFVIKYSQIYGLPLTAFNEWLVHIKTRIYNMLLQSRSSPTVYRFKNIKASLDNLKDMFIITTVDKASNNYSFICKRFYAEKLWNELSSDTFQAVSTNQNLLITQSIKFSYRYSITVQPSFYKLPFFFGIPKFHKNPVKFRFITSSVATAYKDIAVMMNHCLDQLYSQIISNNNIHNFILTNSKEVIRTIKNVSISSLISYDFTTLYTNIKLDLLLDSIARLIDDFWPSDFKFNYKYKQYSKHDILIILKFSLENNYVKAGDNIFKQKIGIPMGASYSVNLANLFLFYYENHFLSSYPNSIDFKYTFRYIDDLLTINNGNIGNTISSIYPSSLALELTNSSPYNSVDYLDLNISIGDDSFPVFKLFDKRTLYSFKILGFPHVSSNIPDFIAFNTFTGQVFRFYTLCYSNTDDFVKNTKILTNKFINNGFSSSTLISLLHKLKFKLPPIRPLIHSFFESENIYYTKDKDISLNDSS